jgi:hypothetical protein
MDSYGNLESQFHQLEGILTPDIFSTTGPQAFPSQPASSQGPPPGLQASEFPSQTRGYAQRSYGNFPRSFPLQAHDAGRAVNIVLPNGSTEAQRYAPLVLRCL